MVKKVKLNAINNKLHKNKATRNPIKFITKMHKKSNMATKPNGILKRHFSLENPKCLIESG
jgi:hypothetical protein